MSAKLRRKPRSGHPEGTAVRLVAVTDLAAVKATVRDRKPVGTTNRPCGTPSLRESPKSTKVSEPNSLFKGARRAARRRAARTTIGLGGHTRDGRAGVDGGNVDPLPQWAHVVWSCGALGSR
jgi:hypothetical protein